MFDIWSKRASARAAADEIVPRTIPIRNTPHPNRPYQKFTTFKTLAPPHPPSPKTPTYMPSLDFASIKHQLPPPLPAPRRPKPGNEIVNNPFRPNVRSIDRLHAWTTPYSQEKRLKDSKNLHPAIYHSAELLWSKGIVDASKSNYAAGLLRFSQFCDRMGDSWAHTQGTAQVLQCALGFLVYDNGIYYTAPLGMATHLESPWEGEPRTSKAHTDVAPRDSQSPPNTSTFSTQLWISLHLSTARFGLSLALPSGAAVD
ncbi:hypothetical protein F5050DRAFT_1819566 [Lentinula boryana]|uniref:Uncharacterized protein n=1 Tax=Lentinula boryana TaxID=40481 RepID=A0ABQ8QCP2_9AGAR|nr:hypothetical protein F5050DRAFT_1819566 [Lentinula boryana]